MDKYEELYRLAKDLVEQTEARFDTIDGKAASYLSVLTILIGAAAFFLKWVTDTLIPPESPLAWVMCVVALGIAASVVAAWLLVFGVLRIHRIDIPPMNEEMIRFFREHEPVDIWFGLAVRHKNAWRTNQAANDAKLAELALGYRMIIFTMMLLVLFTGLYAAYVWLA
ncbi:MAG: hypothetical protein ACE5FJ_02170 [Gemmatimonadales bacterium]